MSKNLEIVHQNPKNVQKIISCALLISLWLGIPLSALADDYDKFMKSDEFRVIGADRCKTKKIKVGKGADRITYELCLLKGKPIIFSAYNNNGDLITENLYKNGKLLIMYTSEFFEAGIGFRNGHPVVEWHKYGKRRVNWHLTAQQKSHYLSEAAKEKRILLKFGIR